MGKIVAIGGGRYDNGEITNIIGDIVSLCDKESPKMLFLPTAGYDDVEGDQYMEQAFRDNGCTTDRLFLTDKTLTEEDVRNAILSADIIYAGGGNLEFLMNTWKETKADKYLREAYEKGIILSGYSSGAMCWFDSGYDDCGPDHSFVFIECLGILPFCNCPHFQGGNWPSFGEAIKTRDEYGIAVDNGAAIVFNEGEVYCVNGNEDGDVYFIDKKDGYKQINITENAEIVKNFLN